MAYALRREEATLASAITDARRAETRDAQRSREKIAMRFHPASTELAFIPLRLSTRWDGKWKSI